jgi:hypothetical protein
MGAIYKPEEAKKRRIKDKALKDLDPNLREPVKGLVKSNGGEDHERKLTESKGSKKRKDMAEKRK